MHTHVLHVTVQRCAWNNTNSDPQYILCTVYCCYFHRLTQDVTEAWKKLLNEDLRSN